MKRIPLRIFLLAALPTFLACGNSTPDNAGTDNGGTGGGKGGSGGSSSKTGGSSGSNSGGSSGGNSGGASGGSSGSGGSTGSSGGTGGGDSSGDASGSTGGSSGNSDAGSTGGASGSTGGTGGGATDAGAALCKSNTKAVGDKPIIDDFEDGDATIAANDGRAGGWWVSKSPTATVDGVPAMGGAPVPVTGGNPGKAIHLKGMEAGTGNSAWGADTSVAIVPEGGCYDVTAYKGVKISLKGTAGTKVFVQLLTAAVRALPEPATAGHFRKEVMLTGDWQDVMVSFATDFGPGWGTPPPLDITKVYGVDVATSGAAPFSFDVWIDNVAFYK
jgi:hypothetical protein